MKIISTKSRFDSHLTPKTRALSTSRSTRRRTHHVLVSPTTTTTHAAARGPRLASEKLRRRGRVSGDGRLRCLVGRTNTSAHEQPCVASPSGLRTLPPVGDPRATGGSGHHSAHHLAPAANIGAPSPLAPARVSSSEAASGTVRPRRHSEDLSANRFVTARRFCVPRTLGRLSLCMHDTDLPQRRACVP